ncbi:acetyl-CoA synthetase-like protein [Aspergillus avenaceus]|uniref:Acetyl-CoA synthetase-like protein n=1 Tax=Aspergillus avenaceus TaxID=36643 RepID=A0A5N6TZD8_ASPAV|nr:acetyl-CoA synthetase-like protein [Aspergillus avenaceus]
MGDHRPYLIENPGFEQSCPFPRINDNGSTDGREVYAVVPVSIEQPEIALSFCKGHAIKPSQLAQACWAVVLRTYTASEYAAFGYVDGTTNADTRLVCSFDLSDRNCTVLEAIQNAKYMDATQMGKGNWNTGILWNCAEGPVQELDVYVDATIWGDSWSLRLGYSKWILSDRQAKTVSHVLGNVISEASRGSKIKDIELCTSLNMVQIAQWNSTVPEVVESYADESILYQCKNRPDAIAVSAWDGSFAYKELDSLSFHLAEHMRHYGVGPDVFVPIYLNRSRWSAVAILAVMRTGGAFVLLDSTYPKLRVEEICRQLQSTVMVSSKARATHVKGIVSNIILVDELHSVCQQPLVYVTDTASTRKPSNALYAIFTSGTTGSPKGVIISHTSYCSAAKHQARLFRLNETSRVLQFASYAFDISVAEHLLVLMVGGRICIPSQETPLSSLPEFVANFKITFWLSTPTVARLLKPRDFRSLDILVLGGEPLSSADQQMWKDHVQLVNCYGPAECSVIAAANPNVGLGNDARIIGKCLNALCWIVDPDNTKLLPIGAIGELIIEGPIVGSGYLADSVKTAESFITPPDWRFRFLPGHVQWPMYRTGDLVQYMSDGSIRYVGRKDAQVKIRGQRLELSEIEHHLREFLPTATDVAVDVVNPIGSDGSPIVVGFILGTDMNGNEQDDIFATPTEEFQDTAQKALSELKGRLPGYMVPSLLIPLNIMPMSRSGKADRRRLRQRASRLSRSELEVYTREMVIQRPPASEMETILYRILQDVLRFENFGMDDNFFNLGGNSVLTMKLTQVAHQAGFDIPAGKIFQNPVLADLAMAMVPRGNSANVEPFALVRKEAQDTIKQMANLQCGLTSVEEIEDIYPATPMQEGMIALSESSSKLNYAARSVFLISRHISIDRLKTAWDMVIRKNPILRTRLIGSDDDMVYQVVVRPGTTWQDGESLTDYVKSDSRDKMGLGDPLLRLAMIMESGKKYFVLTIHHGLYDGFTLPMILEHVESAYYGGEAQSAPFRLFVKYLDSQDTGLMEEYWKNELTDFVGPLFPSLPSFNYKPRGTQSMARTMSLQPVRQLGITTASVIQLGLALALSQFTCSDDVVYGLTRSGRDVSVCGIEDILGPTLTSVPLRIKLQQQKTIKGLLLSVHKQTTALMPYEHFGLPKIRRLNEGAAIACRYQTLLIIQPYQQQNASTICGNVREEMSEEIVDNYALTLEATLDQGDRVHFGALYDHAVIAESFMTAILDQLDHFLTQITSNSDRLASEIFTLGCRQLQKISIWNHHVPYSINACVQDFVCRHVFSNPDATAVDAWDGNLTYSELDMQSERLAIQLQRLNVGRGNFVMVFLGKSYLQVVAMMAVMKAGAAFVLNQAAHLGPAVLNMSTFSGETLPRFQADVRHVSVGPDDPVYAIFTSGSTGRPKGVVVQHRAFLTSAVINGAAQYVDKYSRVLQLASFSFDASIAEILYPLVHGGCVCIPSDSDSRNDLEETMNGFHVTWATMTPSLARALSPKKVKTLRTLALGGEAMTAEDIEMWSHIQLVNGYGPVECCVDSIVQPVITRNSDPSNIGRGMAVVPWVVNPSDPEILLPIGAIGELALEGPILASGYLDDEERTAAAFIEYPSWLRQLRLGKRGRVYKTGDLVQYRPDEDGTIRYIGRKDHQVKLRGQRIELGEVEYHIRQCLPQNRNVTVEIVTPEDGSYSYLAAFIIWDDVPSVSSSTPDSVFADTTSQFQAEIQAIEMTLRDLLPSYMIPTSFIPCTHMPLSSAGKVDRRKLREDASKLSRVSLRRYRNVRSHKRQPNGPAETALHKAVSKVLNLPEHEFGTEDNIFHIGLDSITAMKLVSRLREQGWIVTVGDIFIHSTPGRIAQVMKISDADPITALAPFALLEPGPRQEAIKYATEQCHVRETRIEDMYPCTPLQEGLLSLSMKESLDYIGKFEFKLPETVDLERVRSAWQAVFDVNPILRTRFVLVHSQFLQVVLRQRLQWNRVQSQLLIAPGEPLAGIGISKHGGKYCLVLWLHHALYDGASVPLLLEQADAAFHGQGLSYRPFNKFIEYTAKIDAAACKTFWTERFRGLDTVMFPGSRGRDSTGARTTITHRISIPTSKSTFTLSTMIKLAWGIISGHYVASDDVVYGLVLAGRDAPVPGIDSMTGPTIASLPFRIRLSPEASVQSCLATIQQQLVEMVPYAQAGLAAIRSMSNETAAASEFQCQLVIQPADECPDHGMFQLSSEGGSEQLDHFASYPMLLACSIANNKRTVTVTCNTDVARLDEGEATMLMNQFGNVLQQIVRNEELMLRDIQVISPQDVARLRVLNQSMGQRCDRLVHELVLERCHLSPDTIAVQAWDGTICYNQLAVACYSYAQYFQMAGIKHGSATVVCLEKSVWTVVAILAILQSGSACALIDPSHPTSRIQEIITQTNSSFVVASRQTSHLFNDVSLKVVTVPPETPGDSVPALPSMLPSIASSDPAFILFTSGSTGRPKGIVLEHASISTSIENLKGSLHLDQTIRVLHFASYAFDMSVMELLFPLTFGGTLYIPSEDERTGDLEGFIRRSQINMAILVPSAVELLGPTDVPCLKILALGGEQMTTSVANRWAGKVRLINVYGPAECTFVCATGRVPAQGYVLGTIGHMVNGVGWVTVPSDPSRLAAWGAVGELLIEGPALAREYINNPGKTASSFIRNPPWLAQFGPRGDGRLYRTGDLVQYTLDGRIRYIGRIDRQVKLNGQRLELGEVETRLRECLEQEMMVAAEVVIPNRPHARPVLCAFMVWNESEDSKGASLFATADKKFSEYTEKIRSNLSRTLPRYMVPGAFLPVNYLPRTGTGKIDRVRLCREASMLKHIEFDSENCNVPIIAPSTASEQRLIKLWSALLNIPEEQISCTDNFISRGGDSIIAMKMISQAQKEGLKITVADVFAHPILADLAKVTRTITPESEAIPVVAPFSLIRHEARDLVRQAAFEQCSASRDNIEDVYPCTPLQEGLVSLSLRTAGAYSACFQYRLRKDINFERFKSAWRAVIDASPILRTRIVQADSLFQVVLRETVPWMIVDDVNQHISHLSSQRLQLGQPLLHLVASSQLVHGRRLFALLIHHSVYDGTSLQMIYAHIEQAYRGVTLRPQPFNAFVQLIEQSDMAASNEYWKRQLANTDSAVFPPVPSPQYEPISNYSIQQTTDLGTLPGITKATMIQMAWALVVSTYTDTTDVVFASVQSGRTSGTSAISSTNGPTITTVPLRVQLNPDVSVEDALQELQQQVIAMLPHEQFGLQNIRQLSKDTEAACQFRNLLLIQPAGDQSHLSLWDEIEMEERPEAFSAYPLEVTCGILERQVRITFDYDPQVIATTQAQRVLATFVNVLHEIQDHPKRNVSSISPLSPDDQSQLMQWNSAVLPMVNKCINEGIFEMCKKTPDAVAVDAWDGTFTYGDLHDLTSKLAGYLQTSGAGPGVFIPICMEKSRWVSIAIMGVIQAGGAFVLLDPSLPPDRLRSICELVNAPLIISSPSCEDVSSRLVERVLLVSEESLSHFASDSVVSPDNRANPEDALYVIFTSGSTGKPKGIVIGHRAFYTSGKSQQRALYLDRQTRTLQLASHAFDVSAADYLWTFLVGGCVCVPNEGRMKEDLAGVMNEFQVNRVDMTPSLIRVLRPEDIPTVKTILLGGEPMSQYDLDTWASKVKLVNGYGPSECSVCCVLADVGPTSDPFTIGKCYGATSWVVDKDNYDRLVPIGAIGELLIEGHTLACGYLGQPEATAAAFITSPSWLRGIRPDARLYRTGDLVQYNADGTLRYIGRKDTQVKIRGQRVELGEIEHQIRLISPDIHDVAVELIRLPDRSTGATLVAFLCKDTKLKSDTHGLFNLPTPDCETSSQSLIAALQKRLPSYMVPMIFIPLCYMPLSASGKADRRLLRESAAALPKSGLDLYVNRTVKRPPNTVAEQAMQSVMCDILGLDATDVGMDDDFFALGGDSIIAIRLAERARSHGFTLRVADVFRRPRLCDICTMRNDTRVCKDTYASTSLYFGYERQDDLIESICSSAQIPFAKEDIEDILPVTEGASRFIYQPPEYWIVNLSGPIDVDRLQLACTALVKRHGVLRAVFLPHSVEGFMQIILRNLDTQIHKHGQVLDIDQFVEQHRLQDPIPVPTVNYPVSRFDIVQEAQGKHALIVRLNHAQFDGYCLHILWQDLKCLYEGKSLAPAAEYRCHIQDWMVAQTDRAFAFWRDTLDGATISKIDNNLFDTTKSPLTNEPHFVTVTKRASVAQGLPSGITLATVIKAAWSLLLSQLLGRDDIVFVQTSNGRNSGSSATQNVVGMCLNYIPVRAKISPTWKILDLLSFLQKQHRESLEFELIDFHTIVKKSTSWPKGTTHQSNIVHQNIDPDAPFPFGSAEALVTCCYEWPNPPDEILIESRPVGDELQLTLDTSSDVLNEENAEYVLRGLAFIVEAFLHDSSGCLSDVRFDVLR